MNEAIIGNQQRIANTTQRDAFYMNIPPSRDMLPGNEGATIYDFGKRVCKVEDYDPHKVQLIEELNNLAKKDYHIRGFSLLSDKYYVYGEKAKLATWLEKMDGSACDFLIQQGSNINL